MLNNATKNREVLSFDLAYKIVYIRSVKNNKLVRYAWVLSLCISHMLFIISGIDILQD